MLCLNMRTKINLLPLKQLNTLDNEIVILLLFWCPNTYYESQRPFIIIGQHKCRVNFQNSTNRKKADLNLNSHQQYGHVSAKNIMFHKGNGVGSGQMCANITTKERKRVEGMKRFAGRDRRSGELFPNVGFSERCPFHSQIIVPLVI